MAKSPDAFRTISEVADWLGIQAHVLRFWESKFNQIKPVKRAGGRRYYRPADMLLLGGIRKLLHDDGLTIKGVQKILREQGIAYVSSLSHALEEPLEVEAIDMVADDGDTVVRFQAKGERDRATPEQIDMTLDTGLDDEPADSEVDDSDGVEPEPVAEPAPEPPAGKPSEPGALPSFLHRAGDQPAEPSPETAPVAEQPAAAASAEPVDDTTDPPAEEDIAARPGVLVSLARLDRLTPEQARAAAPLARELRDWLERQRNVRYG